jgi:UDP-glucose 4-epimerase
LKKKILVFGAAGFIGTYLVDELVRSGYQVTASDIDPWGRGYYAGKTLEYVEVDITDVATFGCLKNERFDAVINLAACQPANVSQRDYDPKKYINVNVNGTLNILDYCRRTSAGRVIYASSHRNTEGLWAKNRAIREEDGRSLKYAGEYAMFSISESAAQDCVFHYDGQYGLRGIVFRLPPVYGYGPHTEIFKDGKPIKTGFQIFIEKAQAGEVLEVWGDEFVGRDIIYVKDVVSAFLAALENPSAKGLYNITSGRYLTLCEQAETIASLFWGGGSKPVIVNLPDKPNGMDSFLYANEKAARELGWSPQYSFRDMLVDYMREAESGRFKYLLEKRQSMFD